MTTKLFKGDAAMAACKKLEARYRQNFIQVSWTDVYATEAELLEDLKKVYVPCGTCPLDRCFKGYEYIYSFAEAVQNGMELTARELTQAKRLALEIKKAATAADFVELVEN